MFRGRREGEAGGLSGEDWKAVPGARPLGQRRCGRDPLLPEGASLGRPTCPPAPPLERAPRPGSAPLPRRRSTAVTITAAGPSFILRCLGSSDGHTGAENTCPEVTQQLLKEGFHRDLLIRVNLATANESTRSCMVAVKVHLPKGLYVDPYELTSLQMHNLTEALVITDDIDLEVPEYLATEVSVLIYMRPDPECISCFRAILPLHCRYHRPAENGGKISVALKNPEILIHSRKSFLLMECLKDIEIEAPCSQKDVLTCRWNSVKFKIVSKELKLQIPVGLKHHLTLVCTVTLATTMLCSSLLLSALFKHGCLSFVET